MCSVATLTYHEVVAQNAPSKIHVVTRAYLAGWALPPRRLLRPVSVKFGEQKPKAPAAVGWVREWWGSGDPVLNAACETACARLEGLVPSLLRSADHRWPFADDHERGILAQFIALHVVRTDATKHWLASAREDSLRKLHENWDNSVPFEDFAAVARSDKERAFKLLTMINKLASGFGSMHWTLLRFSEPLIITSDQPVCAAPLLDEGEQRPIQATPATGWANIVEFRFPLSPCLVLVGSWHPGDESDRPIHGDWNHAANINGVLRAQAQSQWFRVHPGPMPAFPSLICREVSSSFEPLAPRLIPGYSSAVARRSPRHLGVVAEIEKLIDRQDDQEMFIARPQLMSGRASGAAASRRRP